MSKNNRILLISNEMSYTGAPHSLLRICKILKKNNYDIEVWSLKDGDFVKEYSKFNIDVKIITNKELKNNKIKKVIRTFNLAICNTVLVDTAYNIIRTIIPTIWYIREAKNLKNFENNLRKELLESSNNLYCVSEYAGSYIKKYYNNTAKIIHNCVEDYNEKKEHIYNKDNKLNILALGTIEPRKKFDIIIRAIDLLPNDYKIRINFKFAGRKLGNDICKKYYEDIQLLIKNKNWVNYLGEIINIEEKFSLYSESDIVIVPSNDESCSLVALESIMMGTSLIVSKNVGAKYVINDKFGWVFDTDDIEQLANILKEIIDKNLNFEDMGHFAREQYLKTSDMEVYEKNILKMVKDNINQKKLIVRNKINIRRILCFILSIKNENNGIAKHSVITILGIKIKIKMRNK